MSRSQYKTAVHRVIGRYMVFVHSDAPPSDSEWGAIVDAIRTMQDLARIRILVLTQGGAPNARQRSHLNDVLQDAKPLVAILTPSAVARAAATALTWFNPRMRLFEPGHLEQAFKHLDVAPEDRLHLREALSELQFELRRASSFPPGSAASA